MARLEVKDLSKSFGKQQVLKDITFQVFDGEIVALVGANGTGKSTLMKLIARHELPTSGEAWVNGISIHEDHPDFNAQIGYASEATDFKVDLPMFELTRMISRYYGNWNQAVFQYLCEMFKVPLDREYNKISRGQKMQFLFSLTCATQPKLLILDEITAVLDPIARRQAMRYLLTLKKSGTSVLLATNILTEVQPIADRLIILENGTITTDKPASPEAFESFLRAGG